MTRTTTHRVTINPTKVQGFDALYLSCPCGWDNAAMHADVAERVKAEHEAGNDEPVTIELAPSTADRRDSYGVLLESELQYDVAGPGLHNPHHPHTIQLWECRERDGQLVDPNGRPTTEAHVVLMSAQAVVITAHPMRGRSRADVVLHIGDTVRLAVNGYPLGEYRIEAGRLSDPRLVKLG